MNITQAVADKRLTLIQGRGSGEIAIRNIGTNPVYLDDTTDVTVTSFPVFPGDVATWAAGRTCYAICGSGLSTTLVLSDSLGNTLGLGNVQLNAGATVGLNPGSQVGINPGSQVGINNTVPVQGARTAQTVAAGATASVVSDITNGSSSPITTTVIPASLTQRIELHGCYAKALSSGSSNSGSGRLVRSDTGADIIVPMSVSNTNTLQQITKDFQGALLPVNVAVQSIITASGFGNSTEFAVDMSYNMVT